MTTRRKARLHRRTGCAKPTGFEYEYKLSGLVALRARAAGLRFDLFGNVRAAGPCDDLVLRVLEPRPALCFAQLKHAEGTDKKVRAQDLTSEKGDFSLNKYFSFYREFHERVKNPKSRDDKYLAEVGPEDVYLLLYTNKEVARGAPAPEPHGGEFPYEALFLTGAGGEAFRFGCGDSEVWNFIKEDHQKGQYQREFLRRLTVFHRQSHANDLDALILQEIRQLFGGQIPQENRLLDQYLQFLKTWAQDDNQNYCLSECSPQLQLERLLAGEFREMARAAAGGFVFEDGACAGLRDAIGRSQEKVLRVAVPGLPPGLRAAKVQQVLDADRPGEWTYVDNAVLGQYPMAALQVTCSSCDFVVLDTEGEVPEIVMNSMMEKISKIIILRSETSSASSELEKTDEIVDCWNMQHLKSEVQDSLMEKTVLFQGCPVPLGDLESAWPRLRADVDGALLGALARGVAALGTAPAPPDDEKLHIPLSMEHPTVLEPQVLLVGGASNHLALSGFPSSLLERYSDGSIRSNDRWTIGCNNEEDYVNIWKQHPGKSIHWLEYVHTSDTDCDRPVIVWRRSSGDATDVAKYVRLLSDGCVRQPKCVHEGQTTVRDAAAWDAPMALLAGEAGAGKSSFLRRAAQEARERSPARWVVFVEVLTHRELLRGMPQPEGITRQHLVDLLAAAAGVAAPASSAAAARRCLEAALGESGAVSVYVDGVDELCPVYKDKMLRLLHLLRKETSVQPLWVSSRPDVDFHLRHFLSCVPASLRPLHFNEQVSYIARCWESENLCSSDVALRLANQAIKALTRGGHSNLLDVPLHVRMAAEAFAPAAAAALRCGGDLRMRALSVCGLFTEFANEKKRLFLERHNLLEASENTPLSYDFDDLHQNCAVYVLVSNDPSIQINRQGFAKYVVKRKDALAKEKSGIMWMDESGFPRFPHFSFVEYFAAAWVSENADSDIARSVVKSLMKSSRSSLFPVFLDSLLAKDLPLHEAILLGNVEGVVRALGEGASVDVVDEGGRLALHLAARELLPEAVDALLAAGSNHTHCDSLMDWTPLQYFDETLARGDLYRRIEIAESLLQAGASPCELTETISRAKASPSVLIAAASAGCLKVTRVLLDAGIAIKADAYDTPLSAAAAERRVEVVELLLACGANVNERDGMVGETALHEAVRTGDIATVQLLLDRGADTDAQGANTHCPLVRAAVCGNVEVLRLLIERSGDEEISKKRSELLSAAVERNHIEAVQMILREGCDVHCVPLVSVVWKANFAMIKCLVEAGANVNILDDTESSVLLLALCNYRFKCQYNINNVEDEIIDIVKYLLDKGSDPTCVSTNGETALHEAARCGVTEIVAALVEKGAVVNATNHLRQTPLLLAAERGDTQCMEYLLEKGADPNLATLDGVAPLHYAAHRGQLEVTRRLLDAGAEVRCRHKGGHTPLVLAVSNGHVECAQLLLARGVDPDDASEERTKDVRSNLPGEQMLTCSLFAHRPLPPLRALCWASMNGSAGCVRLLLDKGCDVNWASIHGITSLHLAAHEGFHEILQLLIGAGARIDQKDNEGRTALVNSMRTNNFKCTELLLKNKANPNDAEGYNPLHVAAEYGREDVLKALIDFGAVVDARELFGVTPLVSAVRENHVGCVKLLLAQGAKPDGLGKGDYIPLLDAVARGHFSVAEQLIVHGASFDIKDADGCTPLHKACSVKRPIVSWRRSADDGQGRENCVKLLLRKGADTNVRDRSGSTALHNAVNSGRFDLVRLLVQAKADINVTDCEGCTPLILAAKERDQRCVEFLLDNRADPNFSEVSSPLHCAAAAGDSLLVEHLIRHGADVEKTDNTGSTPLLKAVSSGQLECVKLLLLRGAVANKPDSQGCTPLHIAAKLGFFDAMLELVRNGGRVDLPNCCGNTALDYAAAQKDSRWVNFLLNLKVKSQDGGFLLHSAARGGCLEVVEQLIKDKENLNVLDTSGCSPLLLAVFGGHNDVAKFLLHAGADPNLANSVGEYPIHGAAMWGSLEMMKALSTRGGSLSVSDIHGRTPLFLSVLGNHEECVDFLLAQHNVEMINRPKQLLLHAAAHEGHVSIAKKLISRGADVNASDRWGNTALHIATARNHDGCVDLLLESKADVHVANKRGVTALHEAARYGSRKTVGKLLDKGALVDAREDTGATPLYIAVDAGHAACVSQLLSRGADANAAAKDMSTPLHRAAEKGFVVAGRALVDKGANVNAVDKHGQSPLLLATIRRSANFVQLLLDSRARPNNAAIGTTVLHEALKLPCKDIAEKLLVAGALVNESDQMGNTPIALVCKLSVSPVLVPHFERFEDRLAAIVIATLKGRISVSYRVEDHSCATLEPLLRLLVERRAALDERDAQGRTALHYAVQRRYCHLVTLLVDSGATVDEDDAANVRVLLREKTGRRAGTIPLEATVSRSPVDL